MRVLFPIGSIAALLAAIPANALCFYTKADFYTGKARSYSSIPQEWRIILSRAPHPIDSDPKTDARVLASLRVSDPTPPFTAFG
jgi:hypothetical protein